MKADPKKYLEDVLLSIDAIEIHIKQVSDFTGFENNITVTDAVERRLAIIGEAINNLDKKGKRLSITNKAKIISLRHILVHEYDLIEDSTIWNIIHHHLPILKKEVTAILNNSF